MHNFTCLLIKTCLTLIQDTVSRCTGLVPYPVRGEGLGDLDKENKR